MSKIIGLTIALVAIGAAGFLLNAYLTPDDAATPEPEPAASSAVIANSADENRIAFSLPDLDGQIREFSDWDGKARLVNFWATWCAPCRREIPLLKQTQTNHADDNFQVIGIAVDFPEQVAAYAEEAGFNYPILVGQEDAMAAAEASGVEFIGMPFTLVVSPDGVLLKAHMGEIVESHIEKIIGVFSALESGAMDLPAAREALREL